VNAATARQRSRTYADLARLFSEPEPGLEQEFTRLFLGPGRPVAHPYESVYREGRTMGDTTLDVRRRLAKAGLAPNGQTLPDHISIELAFMAHLAAREAQAWDDGDDKGALDYLARQASFMRDHLGTWLPQFCRRVLVGRPHAHYADLARRAKAFVTDDAAQVWAWLGNGDGPAMAAARQDWWAVTVDQDCTLCDICVQVCRPGALQIARQDEMAILYFDAIRCDGCAACQRWCPEKIIGVAPADEHPPDGELARSALLACPHCGQLHTPAAMVARVQAQVGTADKTLLQRLTLCHDCKVTHNSLPQSNASS
jgi:TorA maturation chaperone TorD/Pyruvate/2-oxoacid:ferredoxin oxidoreductase delta subunit